MHTPTRNQTRREFLRDAAIAGVTAALGASASPARASSGPVTLEFWDTFTTAEINLLHEMGAEYTRAHPNIKVNFFEIPFNQRPTKIPTAVQTDSLPDIIRADYPYQWYLAGLGKLLVLDDFLKGWEMKDAIFSVAWKQVTYKDHIVGVPQDKFQSIFFYNVDKLAKVGVTSFPTTWDGFLDMAKKLTHGDEYAVAFPFAGVTYWFLEPLIYQWGGNPWEVSGDKVTPHYNSEQAVKALDFLVSLVNQHKVTPPGVSSFDYARQDDAVKAGKVAIGVAGAWQIANYRVAKVPFGVSIGAWPAGPSGRGTVASVAPYMVTSSTKHPNEAVDLIKWLVSKQNALRWAKTLSHEPIDKFTAQDPFFSRTLFKPFQESLAWAHPFPPYPRALEYRSELNAQVQKVLLGQTSSKDALTAVQNKILQGLSS